MKRLSELNMILGAIFLGFMLIVGPSLFIFDSFVQNLGGYIQNFFELATWTETYQQSSWQNSWTVFYWAWWISWSPFVGMFIARISRGRTLKGICAGCFNCTYFVDFPVAFCLSAAAPYFSN
ncbi:MAG: BCCT family transporter [Bacteroidales bacterium]|nr:BCCT family transporter [Bacteroidales bacterium]